MTQANVEGIKVALDAMHAGAELRREQTHAMEAPKQALEPLKLGAGDVSSQAKSIQKTVDELGDKWAKPNSSVELDDGSISDGDGSNWEVRQ